MANLVAELSGRLGGMLNHYAKPLDHAVTGALHTVNSAVSSM